MKISLRTPDPTRADMGRVAWVDYAKGLCIILVVMMHSTLGVEAALGSESWLGAVVAWAEPFRIPAFFLTAALFLSRSIDAPWPDFFDRKLLHFVYFYVLWVTIQFAFKAPGLAVDHGALAALQFYLQSFWQPFGTLWFIYLLPIFFLVTRLLRTVPVPVVLAVAALSEILPVHTGSVVVDEFAARFVYFYAGYAATRHVFAFADYVRDHRSEMTLALGAWAVISGLYVYTGLAYAPVFSLLLGGIGALAIVTAAVLLVDHPWARAIGICGARSIVIYLAFFLPMAATRVVLLKLGVIPETDLGVGVIAAIVTATAIISPLILDRFIDRTGIGRFLFERPARLRLTPGRFTTPRQAAV